ncbi:MAG: hypothetical protein P4M14_00070 [Gammaproteobacteria bacterium]|nr:hypothetical protein [Gammaproteobacteria bacterium]
MQARDPLATNISTSDTNLALALKYIFHARTTLILALSRYNSQAVENGDDSRYAHQSYESGRLDRLEDIIGDSLSEIPLNLWNLRDNADLHKPRFFLQCVQELNSILRPTKAFPPLKKPLQNAIKMAIALLFEAQQTLGFFSTRDLQHSAAILVELMKNHSSKVIIDLLSKHGSVIKAIYHDEKSKALFTQKNYLDMLEILHQHLSPSLFETVINNLYDVGSSIYGFFSRGADQMANDLGLELPEKKSTFSPPVSHR